MDTSFLDNIYRMFTDYSPMKIISSGDWVYQKYGQSYLIESPLRSTFDVNLKITNIFELVLFLVVMDSSFLDKIYRSF